MPSYPALLDAAPVPHVQADDVLTAETMNRIIDAVNEGIGRREDEIIDQIKVLHQRLDEIEEMLDP